MKATVASVLHNLSILLIISRICRSCFGNSALTYIQISINYIINNFFI